jgi:DUF1680 family protein
MERSILNVGLAALGREGSGGEGPGGRGIRYFANQHKVKQYPSMHASCCEGQGTRLFGSLPAFLFSLQPPGGGGGAAYVSVDIYAESTLSSIPLPASCGPGAASLAVHTSWPYGASVSLSVALPTSAPCPDLRLRLRMPSWLPAPVQVSLDGAALGAGAPGTYFEASPFAASGGAHALALSLPMAPSSALYAGSTQISGFKRYSFLFGPVLLSAQGPWDSRTDSLVMPPGLDPTNPGALLVPAGDGNALHFNVSGAPGFTFKPYWEVQEAGELFSNYPCFQ